MARRLVTAAAVLFAVSILAPGVGRAQAFKVQKFDIKGDGGTDYVSVEAATGRVFVSRSTHVMVVEGATGKVLGDIPNTPGVHGVGIAPKAGHGFTTNGGDQTVTMFDLKTLGRDQADQGRPGSRRHHVRRGRRQDHSHESQPSDWNAHGHRSRRAATSWPPSSSKTPRPKGPRLMARATSSSTTKARTRFR